jgi:amino acid permease
MGSPGRYVKKQIRPGGIKSSIFSLIIICLGSGTLTIPYVFYANGLVFGSILIIFGATISLYTGWLVVVCCQRVNGSSYEEIATATYGKNMKKITSVCMLACLIGFVVSYIVLVSFTYHWIKFYNTILVQRIVAVDFEEQIIPWSRTPRNNSGKMG